MDTTKTIINNSGFVFLGNITARAFSFIISLFIARYLGTYGFGNYSFLLAFIYFIKMIDDIWLKQIIIRELTLCNQDKRSVIIGNVIIMKLALSLLILIIIFPIKFALTSSTSNLFYLVLTIIPLICIISSYETIFHVYLKMKYVFLSEFIGNCLLITLTVGIITTRGDISHFLISIICTNILILLLLIKSSKRFVVPQFKIQFNLWVTILKNSLPLFFTAFFIAIYNRIDHFMIYKMLGPSSVGSYSAAVKIIEPLALIPISLSISIFPLMTNFFSTSRENFEKIYQSSFRYLALFIMPVSMILTLFSREIIIIVYGADFSSSSLILSILIWSQIFIFFGTINKQILIATKNQKLDPFFTGPSAFINIILNLVLIPRIGVYGAAIATVISSALGPVMGYFIHTTKNYSLYMLKCSFKPFISSLIMAMLIYIIHLPFIILFILSPVIYISVLFLIKGINNSDFKIIKSIILKRKITFIS